MEDFPIYQISLNQADYPQLLSQIYDPPAILYARGNRFLLNQPTLAIVGSRQHSPTAPLIINQLLPELIMAGLTIVSGLAIGIDALAHQATLSCQGQTIAVLGSGLDDQSIYPRSNYQLTQAILQQGGLLLSEHLAGSKSQPWHFPRRNRLISGLSLGVLIIEAALPSGSLITAKHALEQGREVMAVPGSITSAQAAGTNYLIQQGAGIITSAQDILDQLLLDKA
ncbi:MAG: DNA-processing protein DprA [bacterium]